MLLAIYKWFNRTCLSCHDASRLVSESCERELTFMEKMKLKILCFICPFTARYEQQVSLMHEKISQCCDEVGEHTVAESMSPECKERLKAKLAETK